MTRRRWKRHRRQCSSCSATSMASRRDAEYCSARCRQRARRDRSVTESVTTAFVSVTPDDEETQKKGRGIAWERSIASARASREWLEDHLL